MIGVDDLGGLSNLNNAMIQCRSFHGLWFNATIHPPLAACPRLTSSIAVSRSQPPVLGFYLG